MYKVGVINVGNGEIFCCEVYGINCPVAVLYINSSVKLKFGGVLNELHFLSSRCGPASSEFFLLPGDHPSVYCSHDQSPKNVCRLLAKLCIFHVFGVVGLHVGCTGSSDSPQQVVLY